ncbi:MAG: RNA polymerase sigma factor [Vicinamibacterales bacterium]
MTGKDTSIEDEELRVVMVAYQQGQLSAFDRLYRQLSPQLRSYLGSLVRDPARTADLVQETFLQLHRSRRAYRPELPVRPWVFAIARNVALMDWRARSRRPSAAGELPELPVPPDAASLGDRQAVSRALRTLRDERREAVLLHHVWGFSFAEIAQLLGVTVAAARLRSSRGMSDLRAAFTAEPGVVVMDRARR